MDKIVRLGTFKTYGGRYASTYAHIKLADGKLSIIGVEGPTQGGNALGSCGQVREGEHIVNLAPGWTRPILTAFYAMWDRWHLNNLRSECEHQRDMITLAQECPVCDYQIGTAWLTEELPEYVAEFMAKLPETDRTPAWV